MRLKELPSFRDSPCLQSVACLECAVNTSMPRTPQPQGAPWAVDSAGSCEPRDSDTAQFPMSEKPPQGQTSPTSSSNAIHTFLGMYIFLAWFLKLDLHSRLHEGGYGMDDMYVGLPAKTTFVVLEPMQRRGGGGSETSPVESTGVGSEHPIWLPSQSNSPITFYRQNGRFIRSLDLRRGGGRRSDWTAPPS